MEREQIKNFVDELLPLDLILIRGTTAFAKLIESGSAFMRGNGQFSHCGLVVNREICPSISPVNIESDQQPLLMEVAISTIDETLNLETGRVSLGAQVRDIEKVFEEVLESGGSVAVCHLKKNPYTEALKCNNKLKVEKIKAVLCQEYTRYFANDKSIYDLNIFALLGTIFPSVRHLRDNIDAMFSFVRKHHPWLFCSELACIIYRDLGLLDNNIDTQAYLPVDFVNPGKNNEVFSIMELPPIFLNIDATSD